MDYEFPIKRSINYNMSKWVGSVSVSLRALHGLTPRGFYKACTLSSQRHLGTFITVVFVVLTPRMDINYGAASKSEIMIPALWYREDNDRDLERSFNLLIRLIVFNPIALGKSTVRSAT